MGVTTGCGCKEVYRFPHTTYPYSSCICSFCSSMHPYLKKCFSFLFQYFFVITFYELNHYFFTQYKHTYGQLRASHGNRMKAEHSVLYIFFYFLFFIFLFFLFFFQRNEFFMK